MIDGRSDCVVLVLRSRIYPLGMEPKVNCLLAGDYTMGMSIRGRNLNHYWPILDNNGNFLGEIIMFVYQIP